VNAVPFPLADVAPPQADAPPYALILCLCLALVAAAVAVAAVVIVVVKRRPQARPGGAPGSAGEQQAGGD
jgi:hypothetical protein